METMTQRGFLTGVFALIFCCNVASAQESSLEVSKAAVRAEAEGKPAVALRFYQDAIREAEELGPDDWRLAASLADLGFFYLRQTDYSEAEIAYRHALEVLLTAEPHSFEQVRSVRGCLAVVLVAEGRPQETATLYLQAVEIATASGKEDLQLAATLEDLGRFYKKQGDFPNAERLYERAKAIQIENLDPGSGAILGTIERLAALYEADGKFADAETLLRASIAKKEALPRGHLSLIASLNDLAEFLERQERFTEAELYYERALHQFPTIARAYKDSNVAIVMRNYARLLRKMDQPNKAAEYENGADTFDPGVNQPKAE
jgi:tetratricopeptide (TPR) repeat protein